MFPIPVPAIKHGLLESFTPRQPVVEYTHNDLQSADALSLFYQMIAELSELSEAAEPTAFHQFLRALDDRRSLLRVYTQNIDALEEKSGLTLGVPEAEAKGPGRRSDKQTAPTATTEMPPTNVSQPDRSITSRFPSPLTRTPKCIPLHGTLRLLHCMTCTHSYPLRDYIGTLAQGVPPSCPQCIAVDATRQLHGKRSHGIGNLRPSIVLYNEDHQNGEDVGDVVWKDLMGSSKGKRHAGVDLLLVVGTSLRVPGTKRIVREFSKAVRSRNAAMNASPGPLSTVEPVLSTQGPVEPSPPSCCPTGRQELPVQTICLNLDFPAPMKEWEGVFDVWIRGDAQAFARMAHEELEKEGQAKEAVKERKRKRAAASEGNSKFGEE